MTELAPVFDRADHEASHAAVWWWWVNRPNGVDDGSQGWFYQVTIEPSEEESIQGFTDNEFIATQGDMNACDHRVLCALVGPVSEELRDSSYTDQPNDERQALDAATLHGVPDVDS